MNNISKINVFVGSILESRATLYALLISLTVHVSLILFLSSERIKLLQKPVKQIEVTYQSIEVKTVKEEKKEPKELNFSQKNDTPAEDIELLPKRMTDFMESQKEVADISKFSEKLSLERKQPPKIKTLDMERKITVPVFKSEKITNPKYLTYNDSIRQRIRQRAYSFVDDPGFDSGEVYLTFAVFSDGTLRQVKVIEEKTSAGTSLRNIGLKSIQGSAPFPPFPADLNYPELTFNVVISFEVKE